MPFSEPESEEREEVERLAALACFRSCSAFRAASLQQRQSHTHKKNPHAHRVEAIRRKRGCAGAWHRNTAGAAEKSQPSIEHDFSVFLVEREKLAFRLPSVISTSCTQMTMAREASAKWMTEHQSVALVCACVCVCVCALFVSASHSLTHSPSFFFCLSYRFPKP